MTRRETEEYVVAFKPKPVFEPSIRKRPSLAAPAPKEPPQDTPAPSTSASPPSASPPSPPLPPVETPKSSPTILQPARPEMYNFRFSADRDFKDKFERLAEVVGVQNAQKHMAEILEKALDIALEKPRHERPEEEARAAEKEAARRHGHISFERDHGQRRAGQVSIRCVRGFRASSRTRLVSMRL